MLPEAYTSDIPFQVSWIDDEISSAFFSSAALPHLDPPPTTVEILHTRDRDDKHTFKSAMPLGNWTAPTATRVPVLTSSPCYCFEFQVGQDLTKAIA